MPEALPLPDPRAPLATALIDETRCIGCALCLPACPVDAISGAAKRLHAVVSAWCIGCELCIAPCPVDCIVMIPAGRRFGLADADIARRRHAVRRSRPVRRDEAVVAGEAPESSAAARSGTLEDEKRDAAIAPTGDAERDAAIAAAFARARARRAGATPRGSR